VSLCLGSKVHSELHVSAFLIAWAAARADFAAAQRWGTTHVWLDANRVYQGTARLAEVGGV